MKDLILKDWNAWRLIRFALSLLFIIIGLYKADYILAAAGAFLFFQSVFNTGCCAGGSCAVNYSKRKKEEL